MFGYDELWALTAGFGAIAKQLYPNMVLNGPVVVQLLLVVFRSWRWMWRHIWH